MQLLSAFAACMFQWAAIFALLYGIMEHSTFWVAIAIYCKIVSCVEAYRLGWLKPGSNTLAVPMEIRNERNRNENPFTGIQQNAR